MPIYGVTMNGTVPPPVSAPPPPAVAAAPPPPAYAPLSSSAGIDPALLAAAGVTQAQVDAADAAAAAAAAGMAALLAGEGSAGISQAEAAAGAPQSVIDALNAAAIPDITNLVVTGTAPTGGVVGETDDLAAWLAIANANRPDLSDLAEWDFEDPFGLSTLGVENPALKGGGALSEIAQAGSDYGVDVRAIVADALHEGASGAIGDGGLAYGPFQDHLTEFSGRPFYGKGKDNLVVNAWAWSENGIRYSVRQMATGNPSAKGLTGASAVTAIVYGYERPQDKPGAVKTRVAEYNKLVALAGGWAAYAAPLFKGPAAGGGVDATPIVTAPAAPYQPAGVIAQWRDLVDVAKLTIPQRHAKVRSIADSLVEVFK